jgi:hypothetical protein
MFKNWGPPYNKFKPTWKELPLVEDKHNKEVKTEVQDKHNKEVKTEIAH